MADEKTNTTEKTSLDRMVQKFVAKFKEYDNAQKPYLYDVIGHYADGITFTFIPKGTGAERFEKAFEDIVEPTLESIEVIEWLDKSGKKKGDTVSIKMTDKPDRNVVIVESIKNLDTKINTMVLDKGLSGADSGLGEAKMQMQEIKHTYEKDKLIDRNERLSQRFAKLQNDFNELQKEKEELEDELDELEEIKKQIEKSGESGAKTAAYLGMFAQSPIGKALADKVMPGLSGIIANANGGEIAGSQPAQSESEDAISQINTYMRGLSPEKFKKVCEILMYCGKSEDNLNSIHSLTN